MRTTMNLSLSSPITLLTSLSRLRRRRPLFHLIVKLPGRYMKVVARRDNTPATSAGSDSSVDEPVHDVAQVPDFPKKSLHSGRQREPGVEVCDVAIWPRRQCSCPFLRLQCWPLLIQNLCRLHEDICGWSSSQDGSWWRVILWTTRRRCQVTHHRSWFNLVFLVFSWVL